MTRHTNFKKRFLFSTFIPTAILLFVCLSVFGQTSGTIQKLSLNQAIERRIKGGETHSFQFDVKAGFYARAEVVQKDIETVVSLFAPDGKLVARMDGKDGRIWRPAVSCIAETDAAFRVEIKTYGASDAAGSYTIKLAEARPSVPNDRKRLEAEANLSAGRNFYNEGGVKNQEAVKKFERAAALWHELGDEESEAVSLTNLGWANNELSKTDQAIAAQTRAAESFQKTKDRVGESKALNGLGNSYYYLAQNEKARRFYENALIISRENKDRRGEGVALNNLGNISYSSAQYETAKDYYEQFLLISRETKNRAGEVTALMNLGNLCTSLTQYEKARDYYEQSLVVNQEIKDKKSESWTLNNLGNVYHNLGQYVKAHDYYAQSLLISREIKDRSGEGSALMGIGLVYEVFAQYDKARDFYEQSLAVSREIKDRAGEGSALNNLGNAYNELKQYDKARDYYEQFLVITRETKDRVGESIVYWNLLLVSQKLNNPKLAVLYGKQAVNIIQEIRGNIKGFDKESQRSFLGDKIVKYRHLSNILISEGRLPEAQAVLNLLKDEEYEQLARSGETGDTVPYSRAEAEVVAKIENLVALERERGELQKLQKETGTLSEQQLKNLADLDSKIEAANKAFDNALDALGKAEQSSQTRVDEIKNGKELQGALTRLGAKTKSGVVALYTVLGADEAADDAKDRTKKTKTKFGWVIMVTPDSYKAYPINVEDLEENVFQFRNALSSDKYNPQPLAEKIYTAIFRQTSDRQKRSLEQDLQDYLKPNKDKTIMWSLDGVLRYIPMAALHDGKQYLVENYRSVVFTKNSFVSLTEENQDNWNALGLGVSEKRENFSALPGVRTELDAIVREPNKQTGILNGKIELNANFQKQKFFSQVRGGAFPVVHIASHYSFNPTKLDDSFLLIGDSHLTFGEMKEKQNLFGALDLLTLSACDTGVSGNGKEAEGFAYLAQSLGAKSVIASLWKVSDAGTPELMIRFYKLHKDNPQMPKGEAFRQAQISLLGADTKTAANNSSNRSETVDFGGKKIELPVYQKDEKKPFAHPHYWSSFVLIGNWR